VKSRRLYQAACTFWSSADRSTTVSLLARRSLLQHPRPRPLRVIPGARVLQEGGGPRGGRQVRRRRGGRLRDERLVWGRGAGGILPGQGHRRGPQVGVRRSRPRGGYAGLAEAVRARPASCGAARANPRRGRRRGPVRRPARPLAGVRVTVTAEAGGAGGGRPADRRWRGPPGHRRRVPPGRRAPGIPAQGRPWQGRAGERRRVKGVAPR